MVFGLNDDDAKKSAATKATKGDGQDDQSADAAAELKKMQEKEDSDTCAFC